MTSACYLVACGGCCWCCCGRVFFVVQISQCRFATDWAVCLSLFLSVSLRFCPFLSVPVWLSVFLSEMAPKKKEPKVGEKRKRDPDKPKAAPSAYQLYCNEKRELLKSEQPELSFGEVNKQLGALWKAASAAEQEVYSFRASFSRLSPVPDRHFFPFFFFFFF